MIIVRDLSIGYGFGTGQVTLSQIRDFSLESGSLTALIGPNGVGKSTLLQTLSGSLKPLNGQIKIGHHDLAQMAPELRAKSLSLVLTKSDHSRQLTVAEFVSLGRLPYANWIVALNLQDQEIIQNAIIATDLSALQGKKCSDISYGEMQRVAIARALAQDTSVILLDEHTTHLDLHHKALVLKLLKDLSSKHNKTVLYATHDIELALDTVDQILLMTATDTKLATPEILMTNGDLNNLFPQEHVHFDPKSRRFSMME